jgi:hypothetical protein
VHISAQLLRALQHNNIIFYIEVWVRKEREALLLAANSRSEPIYPISGLAIRQQPQQGVDPPPPNIAAFYIKQSH